MKFNEEEFTKFNLESRLKYEELGILSKALRESFGLNLMGADLLIEEGSGRIYIIDVNYFSSYMDLPNLQVDSAFKTLILSQLKEKSAI